MTTTTTSRKHEAADRVSLANALFVLDVQNYHCPGGFLACQDGDKIASRIRAYVQEHTDDYKVIVAAKMYPKEHNEAPEYEFHKNLWATAKNGLPWPPEPDMIEFDLIFYHGQYDMDVSAFMGTSFPSGSPNHNEDSFGWRPDAYFRNKGIGHIDLCGMDLAKNVYWTAMDARRQQLDTTVLVDLCAAHHPGDTDSVLEKLSAVGVHLDRD